MPPQFVYEMRDVAKSYGDKVVLRDISLSFFYGAKIGIVGENGAGKSTLLKIMAGADKDFQGEARLVKGMRVGYVAQEPHLDLARTVRENLQQAVAPVQALVDRYNAIADRLADAGDEMDK
ncbi:MAG TPA: ATP-binding cassette domain-containing protein, partial [Phycisphaerae bacterium]|nr:ATP-binding cassette domain-containing protein [Phycisphaerae bacterium]